MISKTVAYQEAMEEQNQSATLSGFLEEVALVADIDTVDPDQDYVLLMTLHSAKGLEFPKVFMVGMEAVSYTHLDVYKRQIICKVSAFQNVEQLKLDSLNIPGI